MRAHAVTCKASSRLSIRLGSTISALETHVLVSQQRVGGWENGASFYFIMDGRLTVCTYALESIVVS